MPGKSAPVQIGISAGLWVTAHAVLLLVWLLAVAVIAHVLARGAA